jgi:hypothetical protein
MSSHAITPRSAIGSCAYHHHPTSDYIAQLPPKLRLAVVLIKSPPLIQSALVTLTVKALKAARNEFISARELVKRGHVKNGRKIVSYAKELNLAAVNGRFCL